MVGYFLLAAISPNATVIPSTWHEFARVGVLSVVALICWYWGRISTPVFLIRERNPSTEGFDGSERDVA